MTSLADFDPKNRTQMEVLLPRLLILAGEQTERAGDLSIFGKFDLNVAKFSLLASLARSPRPLTMTEVKNFMVRSPSNLTQMVDQLEKRGLVRRDSRVGDRRVNLLRLTDEGLKLLGQVMVEYERVMLNILKDMSTSDLHTMILMLIDIIRRMFEVQGLEFPKLSEPENG